MVKNSLNSGHDVKISTILSLSKESILFFFFFGTVKLKENKAISMRDIRV